MLDVLERSIDQRATVIGVVGLGYVGLPVACAFAEAGFQVIGVDLKPDRIRRIAAGDSPIEGNEPGLRELLSQVVGAGKLVVTTDHGALTTADVVLIDVETPVDEDHRPRYVALGAACESLARYAKRGALVIVESTVAPGTLNDFVRPIFERAGRIVNGDVFLGTCPERVMPGKLLANLRSVSRVCGGMTPATAAAMRRLYGTVVEAEIDVSDCVTAELVKTAENAYRDVGIAFANELAVACEATGGDFLRVRELVNKSPGRNVLHAGAGVGGHCIPKDPWLLAYGARERAVLRLITTARAVNDAMPTHVVTHVERALAAQGRSIEHSILALLGYAYLENSDDVRNSPSAVVAARFRELGGNVRVHDPWVAGHRGDVAASIAGADAIVLLVAHDEYRRLDLAAARQSMRTPILVDARRLFTAEKAAAAGFVYRAIGRSSRLDGDEVA